ncbi:hypothetical protein FOT43_14535 [Serratia marcescens]|uniref:hypothetical protein n=1 Tax=Serratia marcescens TaxID=615 RepID=UPI00117FCA28|nr:hypothetical protein [Serratia marcescens]TSB27321.1 hypothetical protein FOT43_14535 [Serratia marcescens]TXE39752.1 hypothetical protein FOT60_19615 [Serratia marcescens]
MTLTTERQQFEEWFNEEMAMPITECNSTAVRLMWKAWQASRELLANREAQPVVVAWQHKGEPWRIILDRDIEEVRKTSGSWSRLYTAQPATALSEDVESVVGLLESGEWAEHCTSTVLGQRLESAVTALVSDATPAPAKSNGFKLVPTVPTPEMIAAAMNCDDVTFINLEDFCVNFGNIYAAMLAAAPEGGNG